MVRYLRDAGIADRIITKSNGLLLNPTLNELLADCGLDNIGISVKHVTPEGYERLTDIRAEYDQLLLMVRDLKARIQQKNSPTKIYCSLLDTGLTKDERHKFYADFEEIADFMAIEDLHGWSMSEKADFALGQFPKITPIKPKKVCPLTMIAFVVNPSGTVSMCGEDWAEKTIVGDLRKQTVK